MVDRSAGAYRVLSTLGLMLLSIVVGLWAVVQGSMQIGGLMAGAPLIPVGSLLLAYTLLPLTGVAVAWWRWLANRHAQAWSVLVLLGVVSQFLVGSLFLT